MDSDEAAWILEFILRQQIEDNLMKAIFFALPNPSVDPRLKKTLLLRRIGSDLAEFSISEKTLQSLELIEEIERTGGKEVPESLKDAYCDVVVECTLRPLRECSPTDMGSFFDAFESIWMNRIADLEQSEAAGLISDQLNVLGSELGQLVVNPAAQASILRWDTKGNAMDSLRQYLREALKLMGPPLLELAAEAVIREGMACEDGRRQAGESGVPAALCPTDEDNTIKSGCPAPDLQRETAAPVQGIENMEKQLGINGVLAEGHVPDRSRTVQPDHLSFKGNKNVTPQVQGSDISEGSTEASGLDVSKEGGGCPSKYNIPPTPEFNKLKEALKLSSVELQTVVEDPLRDAMAMAAEVLSSMKDKLTNPTQLKHNQNQADANVPGASNDNGNGTDNLCQKDRKGKAKHSLMDRNQTARTYEWGDDSIESSSEGSHASKKAHLSSPSKRVISPLKVREASKFIRKRRMIKRWSSVEEDTLREGVKRYGKGNWKLILKCYAEIFEERTEVDLKDKWRNIIRQ